jgi:hypothetical protein
MLVSSHLTIFSSSYSPRGSQITHNFSTSSFLPESSPPPRVTETGQKTTVFVTRRHSPSVNDIMTLCADQKRHLSFAVLLALCRKLHNFVHHLPKSSITTLFLLSIVPYIGVHKCFVKCIIVRRSCHPSHS